MKRTISLLAVLGLVAFCTHTANATTLIGGSTSNGYLDETHAVDVTGTGFFLPHPNVWINNGFKTTSGPYQDDLSSEPWSGPAPTPVTTGNFSNPPFPDGCGNTATDGDCGVFFKAFGGNIGTGDLANGILYQDKPAVAGRQYILGGWAGAEANYSGLIPGPTQSIFRISFLNGANTVIGGAALDLAADGLGTPNGQPFNYKYHQFAAIAPAGTATVRVSAEMLNGYSNPAGGGQAFVVDDFALNELVPEPASVALCLLGALGLMGFVRRR